MLQTPKAYTVMCKNPWVDRQVSIRKLGLEEMGVGMEVEARPDGDVNRSVSVRVCFIPALRAYKIFVFTDTNTSTSGTNFRGILRANGHYKNTILPCNSFECHSKLCVGHSFGFPVGLPVPVSPTEIREVFYGNEGIIQFSKVNDLVCDLPASGGRIVSFIAFEPFESFLCLSISIFRSIGQKFASAEAYVSLLMANVLSEVELLEDFTITIEKGNGGKGIYAYINTYDSIIFLGDFKVLSYSNEYMFSIKSEECGFPTIIYELHESAVCSIYCDRYNNSTIETLEITGLPLRVVATASWDIEWDINTIDMAIIIEYSNGIFEQVICYLGMQPIMFSDVFIEPFLETEFSIQEHVQSHTKVPAYNSQPVNLFTLLGSWFKDVESDSLPHFHSNTRLYISLESIYKFCPIPPHPYGWGLLGRGG